MAVSKLSHGLIIQNAKLCQQPLITWCCTLIKISNRSFQIQPIRMYGSQLKQCFEVFYSIKSSHWEMGKFDIKFMCLFYEVGEEK